MHANISIIFIKARYATLLFYAWGACFSRAASFLEHGQGRGLWLLGKGSWLGNEGLFCEYGTMTWGCPEKGGLICNTPHKCWVACMSPHILLFVESLLSFFHMLSNVLLLCMSYEGCAHVSTMFALGHSHLTVILRCDLKVISLESNGSSLFIGCN